LLLIQNPGDSESLVLPIGAISGQILIVPFHPPGIIPFS